MREILYGDEKKGLQEALRGESKVREVLEELFNDEGKSSLIGMELGPMVRSFLSKQGESESR